MPEAEPPHAARAPQNGGALLAAIDFGEHGGSAALIGEGWGPQEDGHRWTLGARSTVRLPATGVDRHCVLVIDAIPWVDATHLPAQAVMLSLGDRLLATVEWRDQRVLAFPLPQGFGTADNPVLTFTQLHAQRPRPRSGVNAQGLPYGLMILSVRLFRLPPATPPAVLAGLPGTAADGLPAQAEQRAGMALPDLAGRTDCLGHNCEFGLVQRALGAEPLGLLRFASLVTHKLVDGLVAGFAGIGTPDTTRIYLSHSPQTEYKLHEKRYYLWYSLGPSSLSGSEQTHQSEQCRRLIFLRRKLLEDLRAGEKLFVVTRPEPLTEPEALAIFCALQIEGPNTLLWTVHGQPERTGQVERTRPGFLRGHLGAVDDRLYASLDAWISVLANAWALRNAANRA